MILGRFLLKQKPSVKLTRQEAYHLCQDLTTVYTALSEFQKPKDEIENLQWKLCLVILHELTHRLVIKSMYIHQKTIKITFKHSEALMLCLVNSKLCTTSIQMIVAQIHHNYA